MRTLLAACIALAATISLPVLFVAAFLLPYWLIPALLGFVLLGGVLSLYDHTYRQIRRWRENR